MSSTANSLRGDCVVTYDPNMPLEISIESTVQSLYGDQIRNQAAEQLAKLQIASGRLHIQDYGALPFTIAARIESAIGIRCADGIQRSFAGSRKSKRSRLYIPGDTPKYMVHAGLYGADAIILDLEDSVSAERKHHARVLVRHALESLDFGKCEIMVRINSAENGLADIDQLSHFTNITILIPKVETANDVHILAKKAPKECDWTFVPILESARGIVNAEEIAQCESRICALALGIEDLTTSLNVKRSNELTELSYAMQRVVTVARAFGLQPLASVFANIQDEEGLSTYSTRMRALGFDGIGCLHPKQVPIANQAFAPTSAELLEAEQVLKAFETANGVASLNGRMIDAPIVERARRLLSIARDPR